MKYIEGGVDLGRMRKRGEFEGKGLYKRKKIKGWKIGDGME